MVFAGKEFAGFDIINQNNDIQSYHGILIVEGRKLDLNAIQRDWSYRFYYLRFDRAEIEIRICVNAVSGSECYFASVN